jgi:hypothetical protein
MADKPRPIRLHDDLASLPLPPEDLWVRPLRRRTVVPQIAVAAGIALVVLAVSLPLMDQLGKRADTKDSTAGSSLAVRAPASASPSSVPYAPGTSAVGGRLVRNLGNTLIIDTVEYGEVTVDLSRVIDIWRETTVGPSGLQPGDNLMVDGTPATPFVALHIYANIGRIDGLVRAIDATGMTIEIQSRTGALTLQRVEFSTYVEYGGPGQPLSRADPTVGRQIGAVLYDAPGETPRATRIWW